MLALKFFWGEVVTPLTYHNVFIQIVRKRNMFACRNYRLSILISTFNKILCIIDILLGEINYYKNIPNWIDKITFEKLTVSDRYAYQLQTLISIKYLQNR